MLGRLSAYVSQEFDVILGLLSAHFSLGRHRNFGAITSTSLPGNPSQSWACCPPIVSPVLNGDQRRKLTHLGPVLSQLLARSSMEINVPK